MPFSDQDLDKYYAAIYDFNHLIRTWGAREVIKDLKHYFPETFEELYKALTTETKTRQLARLLDADQMRRSGTGVENTSCTGERSSSDKGDK